MQVSDGACVTVQERDEARKALETAVAAAPAELANGKRAAGPAEADEDVAEGPAKRVRPLHSLLLLGAFLPCHSVV